jgi:RNA polymerase sigma-70 factor (ECF subfamily)
VSRLTLQIALESTNPRQATTREGNEQALLSRAAHGESEAFDELVRRHEPHVRRLAFRLLGWRDSDVDDVVQDVFLAMLKRIGSFRAESLLSTWLTTITLNRCRSNRRKRLVRLRWLRTWHEPAEATSSDEQSRRAETNDAVRKAVAELSPRDREVIVLFHLEQLPIVEIASLLGVRNNTIEVRLHRARQRLKQKLAPLVE